MPRTYLNQFWNIIKWTFGNKCQWNINRNSYVFIYETAFKNVVLNMDVILSRLQCVNFDYWTCSQFLASSHCDIYLRCRSSSEPQNLDHMTGTRKVAMASRGLKNIDSCLVIWYIMGCGSNLVAMICVSFYQFTFCPKKDICGYNHNDAIK